MFGRKKAQPVTPSAAAGRPVNPVSMTKDASGAPAVNLSKVRQDGHTELADRAETVGVSLQKRGLNGMRGRMIVLVDHSGSMSTDFERGLVQTLLERTLAFGLQIDTDGAIEVIPFDTKVWKTIKVRLNDYRQASGKIYKPNQMGSTNLAGALAKVREIASTTEEAIVCVVLTDGRPDDWDSRIQDAPETTAVICDLARHPVFLKFLPIRPVDYLEDLDNLESKRPGARLLDNVDTQPIADPSGISDADFAEAMVEEWDSWIAAATAAGVLR